METRTILIRIVTQFNDKAAKAVKKAFDEVAKRTVQAASGMSRFGAAASKARKGLGGLASGLANVRRGFSGMVGGLGRAIGLLTGWNTIFGRVTRGMVTWQAWRSVVTGFKAIGEAVFKGNATLETATKTFTALSGGSKEDADRFIGILRNVSLQTGARFDELLGASKRLPTQVGRNFKAFAKLTEQAIVLGMIDPVQGVEGAMFSLANAMEGTAMGFRSLLQRFEIGNMEQVKRLLEETGDPLEAITRLLEESGIETSEFIKAQLNSLAVAGPAIVNMLRELARVFGEPFVKELTGDVVKLRDAIRDNQAALQGMAQAFGGGVLAAFRQFKSFIGELIGDDLDPMRWFDAGVNLLTSFADGMFTALTDFDNSAEPLRHLAHMIIKRRN